MSPRDMRFWGPSTLQEMVLEELTMPPKVLVCGPVQNGFEGHGVPQSMFYGSLKTMARRRHAPSMIAPNASHLLATTTPKLGPP